MLEVPQVDGWGHPIEFYFQGLHVPPPRIVIRSPGCDGRFEGETYETGPFAATDYRQDIVWAEGEFVRWPGG